MMLAGCDETGGFPGAESQTAQTSVSLAADRVILAAPRGYCVDRRSVRRGRDSGFAVLARCDTLGAGGYYFDDTLAVITATVQARSATAAAAAGDFADPAKGRRVVSTRSISGVPVVRLEEQAHSVDGASSKVWRSAFVVNGHAVALALYAEEGSAVLGEDGARLLSELARRTQKASATAAAN